MTLLRVARLTPEGRGAIGTVLLWGEHAFDIFGKFFTRSNGQSLPAPIDRPVFGRLALADSVFEEIVAVVESPVQIEIHAHGGEMVLERILSLFVQEGARSVAWSESFDDRTVLEQELFAILPYARTERTAALLMRQLDGRWEHAVDNAGLDEQRRKYLKLLAEVSKHLTEPYTIVLTGPANAGKSSLLNVLCGWNRAIVDSTAGTTRDAVSAEIVLDGFPFRLIDTAGFRSSESDMEQQGINLARQALETADLILLVLDVADSHSDPLQAFWSSVSHSDIPPVLSHKAVLVLNKCDLPQDQWNSSWSTRSDAQRISVLKNQGIDELIRAILRRLIPVELNDDTPLPLSDRQRNMLSDCKSQD